MNRWEAAVWLGLACGLTAAAQRGAGGSTISLAGRWRFATDANRQIPAAWRRKRVTLLLVRAQWETQAWLDERYVGSADTPIAPHVCDLGAASHAEARQLPRTGGAGEAGPAARSRIAAG